MNDKLSNDVDREHESIAHKLNQVAEQTHAGSQFAADLEERLRGAHQPKTSWFSARFAQVSPTLRWVALMIVLALVLSWSIKTLIPAPQPAIDVTPSLPANPTPSPDNLIVETSTPATKSDAYDFRGAKLFLAQPLPESPESAHVYRANKSLELATREQALALAERFGIQGEMYTAPGLIYGTTDYVISDGKQFLQVHSDHYFTYTADNARYSRAINGTTRDDAETIIREFLTARGFDFPSKIYRSDFFGGYVVQPLAPDSIPLQYESFTQPTMRVALDENGNVLAVDASLMDYDQTPIGDYGIIDAREALQKLLDDSVPTGKMESMHSANNYPREWYREYPDNQTVTIYGYVTSIQAADPNKPALITVNGSPAVGNTAGMEQLNTSTFLRATGQFSIENGIRKFNVESWDRKILEAYVSGTLHRQGDQTILTSDDGTGKQYPLIDPPADVPLDTKVPDTQLAVSGVIVDGKMFWTYIQYFDDNNGGGGGGGGGGLGFYQLNLSGTPVTFPSPTPQPETANALTGTYTIKEGDTLSMIAQNYGTTVDALMQLNRLSDTAIYIGQTLYVPVAQVPEQRFQDLRGYLSIRIHNKSDGTSSREYSLEVIQDNGSSIYPLEGSNLGELDAHNGLPILVTGTLGTSGRLALESYRIPYPDLHFQILKGTQRSEQLEGQTVILFTTEDGQSYVEFLVTNNIPKEPAYTGYQGDIIQQEVLIIPDETFGGMPVAHIYQSSIIQPDGPEMEIRGNQIYVFNDSSEAGAPTDFTQPNLTIDQVELAYFINNPYYQVNDPNYSQRSPYLQPVWHFHGHYDDGSEFDMLIQALKQEYLLPELAPSVLPG